MKKLIGYSLISIPIIGLLGFAAWLSNGAILIVLGITAVVMGCIYAGVRLISN